MRGYHSLAQSDASIIGWKLAVDQDFKISGLQACKAALEQEAVLPDTPAQGDDTCPRFLAQAGAQIVDEDQETVMEAGRHHCGGHTPAPIRQQR